MGRVIHTVVPSHVETCVLLSHQHVDEWVYIDYEPENSDYLKNCNFQATYGEITEWVMKTYGEHVSNLNIAQMELISNDQTSDELLHETAKKIVEQTTGYCGGTGEIIIPKVITVTEEKKECVKVFL